MYSTWRRTKFNVYSTGICSLKACITGIHIKHLERDYVLTHKVQATTIYIQQKKFTIKNSKDIYVSFYRRLPPVNTPSHKRSYEEVAYVEFDAWWLILEWIRNPHFLTIPYLGIEGSRSTFQWRLSFAPPVTGS